MSFIKIETLAQVFSYEFCEISEKSFSYRTPPVAASGSSIVRQDIKICHKCYMSDFSNFTFSLSVLMSNENVNNKNGNNQLSISIFSYDSHNKSNGKVGKIISSQSRKNISLISQVLSTRHFEFQYMQFKLIKFLPIKSFIGTSSLQNLES